jgi:hypothetical protein
MDEQWSEERERQYRTLHRAAQDLGASPSSADQMAMRTVEWARARSGETT